MEKRVTDKAMLKSFRDWGVEDRDVYFRDCLRYCWNLLLLAKKLVLSNYMHTFIQTLWLPYDLQLYVHSNTDKFGDKIKMFLVGAYLPETS